MNSFLAKIIKNKNNKVQLEGYGGAITDALYYSSYGLIAHAPHATLGLAIRAASSKEGLKFIASEPPSCADFDLKSGDCALYAVNEQATRVKAALVLRSNGKVSFYTDKGDVFKQLIDGFKIMATLKTTGSATAQTISPDDAIKLQQVITTLEGMVDYGA